MSMALNQAFAQAVVEHLGRRGAAIERAMKARMLLGVTPDRMVVCERAHVWPAPTWLTVDGRPVWGLTYDQVGEYRWVMREMRPEELQAPWSNGGLWA